MLLAVGGIAPSLWGVVFIRRSVVGRQDFWARLTDPRRIPLPVWLTGIVIFPLLMLVSIGITDAIGGQAPDSEPLVDVLTSPLGLVAFLVVTLVAGPLSEELGWRGFALDQLQARFSALAAALLLAVVHVVWHVPLFFMDDTIQDAMGFATVVFWAWAIQIVALNVLITWAYNTSARSILVAILFHFMANVAFSSVVGADGATLPEGTAIAWASAHVVVAAFVVAVSGPRNLQGLRAGRQKQRI